ncbi:MAG TPA: aminoglycoside phosphotransferase family protein [Anaerolineae bacterium]|nr:aminoglycoside phosphotransferase family protein [Anaerolineae bacterium]
MLLPHIETWEQWGKIFTDVPRWTPAVQEICRQAGIPFHTIEAGFPGTNAVFVLDHTYVLKIYAPFCHRDYALERFLNPLVTRHGIPAPAVLAEGVFEDRIRWPYIVMNFLPGQPIREVRAQIPRANLLDIAADLGRIVRALHQIPLEDVTLPELAPDSWMSFVKKRRAQMGAQNRREGKLPLSILKEIPHFLTSVLAEMEATPLRLVNGDLTEDHLLLEQRDGRWQISGLIDFADSLVAPTAYEWAALWFSGLARDAGCLRQFMAAYDPALPLDAAFFCRAMAFTFLHEFGAGILAEVMEELHHPPLSSIAELQTLLWETKAKQET